MKKDYRLQEGEKLNRNPHCPIIGITGNGKLTYLWIGNNAPTDKFCFATMSGKRRLELLAKNILKAINSND